MNTFTLSISSILCQTRKNVSNINVIPLYFWFTGSKHQVFQVVLRYCRPLSVFNFEKMFSQELLPTWLMIINMLYIILIWKLIFKHKYLKRMKQCSQILSFTNLIFIFPFIRIFFIYTVAIIFIRTFFFVNVHFWNTCRFFNIKNNPEYWMYSFSNQYYL